jgi:two-component system response regulator FlrC
VALPPLRDRREDIAPLAERLLSRIAVSLGRPDLRLTDDARHALAAAPWPGTVRELANALERSAILADRSDIAAADLAFPTGAAASQASDGTAAPVTMTDLERQAIEAALAATGGNRRLAAARLGIGLRTLYEKLKRYGL